MFYYFIFYIRCTPYTPTSAHHLAQPNVRTDAHALEPSISLLFFLLRGPPTALTSALFPDRLVIATVLCELLETLRSRGIPGTTAAHHHRDHHYRNQSRDHNQTATTANQDELKYESTPYLVREHQLFRLSPPASYSPGSDIFLGPACSAFAHLSHVIFCCLFSGRLRDNPRSTRPTAVSSRFQPQPCLGI